VEDPARIFPCYKLTYKYESKNAGVIVDRLVVLADSGSAASEVLGALRKTQGGKANAVRVNQDSYLG